MGGYIAASHSEMAILLTIIATFASVWLLVKSRKSCYVISLTLLLWATFSIYHSVVPLTKVDDGYNQSYQLIENTQVNGNITAADITMEILYYEKSLSLSLSISERVPYWQFYGDGAIEDIQSFLFGHLKRPDRNKYPSAQNYYLDLIYHFGIISLIPFFILIGATIKMVWRFSEVASPPPSLFMLIVVVSFFVFFDAFFMVSFRQPYSGMMMFFLWGVLLMKLSDFDTSLAIEPFDNK